MSQAIHTANEFVTWMKTNTSSTLRNNTFYRHSDSGNDQETPFVTYSTLVFTYEWKETMKTEGGTRFD